RAIAWESLKRWTQQRLHEPLTVAQLAAQVFLSPTQFAVRCRRETGLSVMQWLRQQRLALAVQLRARGLSVADTALQCGYRSPSALTAALRLQRLQDRTDPS
ncbi:MAG: helix-turn-helix transcriptional regulator, partial [Polaromonas sp.]